MTNEENQSPTVAVLDIDMTIVCTMNDGDEGISSDYLHTYYNYKSLRSQLYLFKMLDNNDIDDSTIYLWGLKRPYLKEFLTYINDNYDYTVIWTAAMKDYADAIVSNVLNKMNFTPDLVWSRDECELVSYAGGSLLTKPLSKLSNHFGFSMNNAILIDDQPYNHVKNSNKSKIQIPQYEPIVQNPVTNDTCLLQLMDWLSEDRDDNDKIFKDELPDAIAVINNFL